MYMIKIMTVELDPFYIELLIVSGSFALVGVTISILWQTFKD